MLTSLHGIDSNLLFNGRSSRPESSLFMVSVQEEINRQASILNFLDLNQLKWSILLPMETKTKRRSGF